MSVTVLANVTLPFAPDDHGWWLLVIVRHVAVCLWMERVEQGVSEQNRGAVLDAMGNGSKGAIAPHPQNDVKGCSPSSANGHPDGSRYKAN